MRITSRILVSSTALIACGVFLVEAATFDAGDSAWALSLDRRAAGDIHDVAESGDHLFVAVSTIVGRMEPAMTERLEFDDVVEIEGTPRYLFALPHALAILTAPSRVNEYVSRSERENPWHIELRDPVMLSRLIGRLELDIEVVDATHVGEHIFVLGFRGDWASEGVIIAIRFADHEEPSLVAERSLPGMVGDRIGGLTGDGDRLYAIVESLDLVEGPEERTVDLVTISLHPDRFLEQLGSTVIGDGSMSSDTDVLHGDDGRVLVTLLDDFEASTVVLAMDDPAEPRVINRMPIERHAGILRGDIALIAASSGVYAFDVSRRGESVGPPIGILSCPSFFTEAALFGLEGSVYISCGDLFAAAMDLRDLGSVKTFRRDAPAAFRVVANDRAVCTTAHSDTLTCTEHKSGRSTRYRESLLPGLNSAGPYIAIGERRLAASTSHRIPAIVQVWNLEDDEPVSTGVVDGLPHIESLAASGEHVFVLVAASDGGHGVFAIDATDASSPTLEGFAGLSPRIYNDRFGMVRRLAVSGDVGLARTGEGVHVIDVSAPSAPRSAGSVAIRQPVQDLAVAGGFGFVLTERSEDAEPSLIVIDLSDVDAPTVSASLPVEVPRALAVADGLILVADGALMRLFALGDGGGLTEVAERHVGSLALQIAAGGGRFHAVSSSFDLLTLRPVRRGMFRSFLPSASHDG